MNKRITILSTLACGAFVAAVAPAQAAVLITPVGVTASAADASFPASLTIDDSGLSGTAPHQITDTHAVNGGPPNNNAWYSGVTPPPSVTITFDLGSEYAVSDLHIWQYPHPTTNWAKDITVEFSTTGTSGLFGNAETIQMPNQTGVDAPAQNFALTSPVNADAVKFTIDSTWSNFAGLGEVKFTGTAIPEPSAALLGAFGLLALLRRRRR